MLADIGERYHEHRRATMLLLWVGLTDLYNLFHANDLSPALVAKVCKKDSKVAEEGYQAILGQRSFHRGLDEAVRNAYGWQDLKLDHDFYEVETLSENDRVRYTISPTARKEVLRLLLALNHERAQAEQATQAVAAPKQTLKIPRSSSKSKAATSGLYVDQEGEQLTNGRPDV